MHRRGLVALLFCACHTTSAAPPVAPSVASAVAPSGATVAGHGGVDPAAGPVTTRGALFVSWLTEAEKPAFDQGRPPTVLVRDLLNRGVVVRDVDAAQNAVFTLPAGRGRIALIAALDVSHVGLPAI